MLKKFKVAIIIAIILFIGNYSNAAVKEYASFESFAADRKNASPGSIINNVGIRHYYRGMGTKAWEGNSKFSRVDGEANKGFFCINPHALLPGLKRNEYGQARYSSGYDNVRYKVIANIEIIGSTVTCNGISFRSEENAKMALILSADNRNSNFNSGRYSNLIGKAGLSYGSEKDTGPVANLIWNYYDSFARKVGARCLVPKLIGVTGSIPLYRSTLMDNNGKKNFEKDSAIYNSIKDLNDKASKEAKTIYDLESGIIRNFNQSFIKFENYGNYIKIGPFNYKFADKLDQVTVSNMGNEIEGVKYYINNKIYNNGTAIISGQNFYILIPKTSLSQINFLGKVKIYLHQTYKVPHVISTVSGADTTSETKPQLKGEHNNPNGPNSGGGEGTVEKYNKIEDEIGFGNLEIEKYYEEKGTLMTIKKPLKNVTFNIKNESLGLWIIPKKNFGGITTGIEYKTEQPSDEGVFETDIAGKITLENILPGKYIIYEKKNKNFGFETNSTVTQTKTLSPDKKITFSVKNERTRADLKIIKVDKDDHSIKLPGVKFKIEKIENGKSIGWLKVDEENGDYKYVSELTASIFETKRGFLGREKGEVVVKGLVDGEYKIHEIYNPVLGYEQIPARGDNDFIKEVKVSYTEENPEVEFTFENERLKPDLILQKVDQYGVELKDAEFKIKHIKGINGKAGLGWVKYEEGKKEAEYDQNQWTPFKTKGSKGKTITIPRVEYGTYEVYEIKKPNEYFDEPENPMVKTFTIELPKVVYLKPIEIEVENERKYVDISGIVWEEIATGKGTNKDNLYKFNISGGDKLLKDIEVTLKYKGTNTIYQNLKKNTKNPEYTDNHGKYMFEKVEISELDKLYVEFKYNGLNYRSVDLKNELEKMEEEKYLQQENGSKAIEDVNSRKTLNSKFEKVKGDSGNTWQGSKGHTEDIDEKRTFEIEYEHKNNEYYYSYVKKIKEAKNLEVLSTTKDKCNFKSEFDKKANQKNKIDSNRLNEIKGINLGVVKRLQPNLIIMNNLEKVTTSINGYTQDYQYGYLKEKEINLEEEDYLAKRQNNYKSNDYYYRSIQNEEDYKYNALKNEPEAIAKKLKIEAFYKVNIFNGVSGLGAKVYGIDQYYDKNYKKEFSYKLKNSKTWKKLTQEEIGKIENITDDKGKEYRHALINLNGLEITNDTNEIDICFEVDIDAILQKKKEESRKEIKDLEEFNTILDNIVEINAYSTFVNNSDTKETYAGIDTNSNPHNVVRENKIITDRKYYEDDTDIAPGFNINFSKEHRKITGNLFLDESQEKEIEIYDDKGKKRKVKVRQGNGIKDDTDKNLENVKVELYSIEKDKNGHDIVELFDEPNINHKISTNNQGEYQIEGFIPGDYKIRYTWGEYEKVEDGKNITIKTRTKDSIDINVRDYKSTIVNKEEFGIIPKWYIKPQNRYSDAIDDFARRTSVDKEIADKVDKEKDKKEYRNNEMISDTPIIKIGIELETPNKYDKDEELIENETDSYGITNVGKDGITKKEFEIKNIDFGIVERPLQEISIEKTIKRLIVKLPMKNNLVDATIDENGNLKDMNKMATHIAKEQDDGFIKVEVDNELMQQSNIVAKYGMTVTNNSELDFPLVDKSGNKIKVGEEFYKYGIPSITDSSGKIQHAEKAINMEIIKIRDFMNEEWAFQEEKENPTWKSDTFVTKEGTEIPVATFELKDSEKVIGAGEKLEIPEMELTKEFAKSTGDALTNFVEIQEMNKTSGRELPSVPGNYDPKAKDRQLELDEDSAPEIKIIPATGGNRDYTLIISSIIGSLTIIIIGIVAIKKKVLGINNK